MAKVIWSDEALLEAKDITEFIELDKPLAAIKFAKKLFADVDYLEVFPYLGKEVEGLGGDKSFRELVIPPCRVFYRVEGVEIYIVHVVRAERKFRVDKLNR